MKSTTVSASVPGLRRRPAELLQEDDGGLGRPQHHYGLDFAKATVLDVVNRR
jgi:hypothetical protein